VFMLRVSGPVAPVISSASKIIHKNVPKPPAPVAMSMEETVNESLASERILAMLAASSAHWRSSLRVSAFTEHSLI
jgi:hypothetical protein